MQSKDKLISFDELNNEQNNPKPGLFSKILERVKNTVILENYVYPQPAVSTAPLAQPNVQVKVKKNEIRSGNNRSQAVQNLRKTVERTNQKEAHIGFNIRNALPKFIFSSSSEADDFNNGNFIERNEFESPRLYSDRNEEIKRLRSNSLHSSTPLSSGPEDEINNKDIEIKKKQFYKHSNAGDSASSLFNTRPTEAVAGILRRLQGQGGGINKDYWMKDEHCHECYNCGKPFTQLFRRKHHCRICGQIFCFDCANKMIPGDGMGQIGLIRVCDYCFSLRNTVQITNKINRANESDSTTHVGIYLPNVTKEQSLEEFNSSRSPINTNSELSDRSEGLKKALTYGTRVANSHSTSNSLEFRFDNSVLVPYEPSISKKDMNENLRASPKIFERDSNSIKSNDHILENNHLTDNDRLINRKDTYSMITGFKGTLDDALISNEDKSRLDGDLKRSNTFPRKSLIQNSLTSPNARKLMRKLTISSIDHPPTDLISKKSESKFDTHLTTASSNHLKRMINELLIENELNLNEGWENIIYSLVTKASFHINMNIKEGDSMDIHRYVKIKRIPGGFPSDSEYIDGVVCTKNLTHKMMPRFLSRPRILILTFPFEYQRVEYQFMSIEPVMAQESEHLKNMVARVLALRPTLVIAERTISRIALDFLHKANLCVAMNVKRSVIRAIARCTQAEIISSLDQLWLEPMLGDCQTFEVKTFMHELIPNWRKSYLYFKGCEPSLGCTIILRGAMMEKLGKLKRIMRILLSAAYSLKLETVLLRDELAKIPSTETLEPIKPEYLQLDRTCLRQFDMVQLDPLKIDMDDIILPYQKKTLSSSPFTRFPVPYLLIKMKEEIIKIKELTEKYKLKMANQVLDSLNSPRPGELELPFFVTEDNVISKEANLQIEEHIWNLRSYHAFIDHFQPPLSLAQHQSISILYCNVSTTQNLICQPPQSFTIEYYKSSDLTLGQFLELSCFDLKVLCGTCDQSVLSHSRSYVHGDARVTVTVEELPSPISGMESTILMWSYCKICEKVLPVVPMADETWKLSLGKYLELSFYHDPIRARANICSHDIHRDHVRYFGYNDLAAKFEYETIDLFEVYAPPTKLYFNPEISKRLKLQDFETLTKKINAYWDSVSEKTKALLMYSISSNKSEVCTQELMEMSRRVSAERSYTLQILQQTFLNSHPSDTLALNLVLRVMHEKVIEWDNEFNLVIRRYLQTEKDLRRLTAHQLRRLFPDRELNENHLEQHQQMLNEIAKMDNKELNKEDNQENDSMNSFLPTLGSSPSSSPRLNSFNNSLLEEIPNQLTYTPIMDARIYRRHSLELMLEEKQQKEKANISPVQTPAATTTTITHNPITPIARSERNEDYLSIGYKKSINKPNQMNLNLDTISNNKFTEGFHLRPNKVPLGNTISKNDKVLTNKYSTGTLTSKNLSNIPKLNLNQLTPANHLNNIRMINKPIATTPSFQTKEVKSNSNNNRADKNIKNKYNLKSIDKTKDNKKKFNNLLNNESSNKYEFNKFQGKNIKRSNTTATSRPSRQGKAGIEIYLNTKEAVLEESSDSEEEIKEEFPVIKAISGFDDLLSPTLETQVLFKNNEEGELTNPNLVINPKLDILGSHEGEVSPTIQQQSKKDELDNNNNGNEINNNNNNNNNNYDRSSIIQTISSLLGGANSIGQVPLEYPLNSTEHLFSDSPIILREDEPSSIIAFSLSTSDYRDQIYNIRKSFYNNEINQNSINNMSPKLSELSNNNNNNNNNNLNNFKIDIEKELKNKTGHHMRYQLFEGSLRLTCKIFFALQFEALRQFCDMDSLFIESLARCVKWEASGGKSSALFLKTRDNRLVMKEVSKAELDAFLKFAPLYFGHMAEALFDNLPILLAKIFGIYRLQLKNIHTGKTLKLDVLIMENLFYERQISRIFDLKGSFRNRHVRSTGQKDEVLLDENLMELICKNPIFVRADSKQRLHMAIFNDTKFLSMLKVMDYSLLVGMDEVHQQLVVGIVDFIRTFTWDKKLESWVKESGILGGGGELPTIVSPSNYKHRFRYNIDGYFLLVPDKFYSKKLGLVLKNGIQYQQQQQQHTAANNITNNN